MPTTSRDAYRIRYPADEAARDIVRLAALDDDATRATCGSTALTIDAGDQLRLKIYRLGGALPLSDAVPVLENFGFRVLEEMPTPLDGGDAGYIHEFLARTAGGGDRRRGARRAPSVDRGARSPRCSKARPRTTRSTS